MKKSRLDVECVCGTCALVFTLHGVDKFTKDIGDGYELSGLRCPNCEQQTLNFDMIRVEDNGFVEWHQKAVRKQKLAKLNHNEVR